MENIESDPSAVGDDFWRLQEETYLRDQETVYSLENYHQSLLAGGDFSGTGDITVSSAIVTNVTSGTASFMPAIGRSNLNELGIEIQETIWEDLDVIKKRLENFDPKFAEDIDDIIQEWSSLPEDRKWRILTDLRDCIFTRFFEKAGYSTKSQFKNCSWFEENGKRFPQAKYFIQGCKDDSEFIPPVSNNN